MTDEEIQRTIEERIKDAATSGADFDRIMDRTEGKATQRLELQQFRTQRAAADEEHARYRRALEEIAQETGTPYARIAQAALDGKAS